MSDDFDFSTGRPSQEMAQYLQLYLDETSEQLDGLVEALLVLETRPADAGQLNEAFRLIHSIKGSSAMMGLDTITALTHHLENHFERLRSRLRALDATSMALILRCTDFLRECNRRLRAGQALGSAPELLEELNSLELRSPDEALGALRSGLDSLATAAAPDGNAPADSPAGPPAEPTAMPPPPRSAALPLASLVRHYRVEIRFEPNLALVDLKAELVLARLAEIGDVRESLPDRAALAMAVELRTLQVLLSSAHAAADLEAAADVDGVEAIDVHEGAAEFALSEQPNAAGCVPVAAQPTEAEKLAEAASDESAGWGEHRGESGAAPLAAARGATDVAPAEPAEGRSKVAETVRVDIERLDKLMNLTGELVVNKARFVQITRQMSPAFRKSNVAGRARAFGESMRRAIGQMKAHLGNGGAGAADWREQFEQLESEIEAWEEQSRLWEHSRRFFGQMTEAIDQFSRVSDSLQRGVLDTRMVPVAPLFNRFKRVVRDIALELDKKVRLEIHGEKTELDKRMIDELGDPLVHLVRNSIDHGIESAEVRSQRGKPEVGTICLEAAHSGNNVYISVRDDGGGIPIERVRQRIVERKLATVAVAQELSDREVVEYIWHPGFSTAERVSDISGRGVGMDIVKTRIAELNGTVDIQHESGRGTTFTIRLPLTLAIIRSLLFRLRHGMFAVPIDNVREIVSVPVEEIITIHGNQTFEVRGEFIPLVDIDDVFDWHGVTYHYPGRGTPVEETRGNRLNVVILHAAERKIGLKVAELQGGQDIVIKSLAENFISIRGLSGASILGDGSVCLLLDVAAVIAMTSDRARRA